MERSSSRVAIDSLRPPETALVFGAVIAMDAQVTVFGPGAPGFARLFPTPPQVRATCADQGVLGALASLTAQIMAAEAMKLAQGLPSDLAQSLLLIDARDWRFTRLQRAGTGG